MNKLYSFLAKVMMVICGFCLFLPSAAQAASVAYTGDSSNTLLWIVVLVFAVLALGGVAIFYFFAKRKKDKDQD
ncbi:MAG: LPXTG cell wall anchor domain-containing protein [Christensenellaceae bacterium]